MKKLTVLLMIVALMGAWAPAASAACCAAQPAHEMALTAPSCCETACPAHLAACDEAPVVQPLAVVTAQPPWTQPQAAPATPAISALPATVTVLASTFLPDDRQSSVAIYDLTKTYRL